MSSNDIVNITIAFKIYFSTEILIRAIVMTSIIKNFRFQYYMNWKIVLFYIII